MINNRVRFLIISLTAGVLLLASSLVALADRNSEPEADSLYKYLSVFTEVLGLVRQTYVEETDIDKLMAGAFEGTADALDAFSVYIPPEQVEKFQTVTRSETVETGLFLVRDRGWVYVTAVADGSTAELAGIQSGDLLSRIDGESTRELDVWEIEAQFAAKAGREIGLEMLRQGETIEMTLPVERTATPSVTVTEQDAVHILRIARISDETTQAIKDVIATNEPTSLLIDLRGVSGGSPKVAFEIAGLFASGPLGSLQTQGKTEDEFVNDDRPLWVGELAVLADRGTLGAAELLLSVLQQSAGAQFVGESTYGWAGRSDLVSLSTGGLLVITGAFYAGPDGEILDSSLSPDVAVTIRERTLSEKDLTLDELILRRGIELLQMPAELEKVAA